MIKKILPLMLLAGMASPLAQADSFSDKIEQAMASEHRSEKDKKRDGNRLPVETLKFFGIEEDMKVVELVPGRGWYTQLLAPALKDKGELYVALGVGRLTKIMEKGENPNLKSVKTTAPDAKLTYNEDKGFYDLKNADLGVKGVDAVLTFRNYHNFTREGRMMMNQVAFDALKPGGIYGVVDHTRRHMQATDKENRRRIDPVLAIKEILEAGFEFVDYSDLHYKLDDELRYEVGRKSVTGNTDRFTLMFKKPMK